MLWIVLAAAGFPVAATVWVAWRALSPPRQGTPDPMVFARHRAETVSVKSGGRTLTGYRVLPKDRGAKGVVVLIHGWGSSGSDMLEWSVFLAEAGWASLAIDMRGHGGGQREPVVTAPKLAQDVEAAWVWAGSQEAWRDLPKALLGHSMGGAASLCAIVHLGVQPKALILSGAFARVEIITEYVLRKWMIPAFPFGNIVRVVWRLRTGLDLRTIEPETTIRAVQVPILVTHGAEDPVVPHGEMDKLLRQAPPGTESVEIPRAGHSNLCEFSEYREAIVSFLNRSVFREKIGP